ncbi:MAG: HAMP domain-containing sensor histidine kinase, partial [Dehalococcoidia bacterium]
NAWLDLLPGLAWAGFAALMLSALMAVLLSRSIARPVLALTHAAEEMARGNFDQEVSLASPDEIRRLAVTFNTMAREVGRSHGQMRSLIANVSHDLRTPLTSILGFAQALRDGTAAEPDEVRELSGIVLEEASHIFDIVDDLLYLSQIEAGEVILSCSSVNLADLGVRCLRRIEPLLHAREITVRTQLDERAQVIADGGKLERVLDNLLDNARKYTPAGGAILLCADRGSDGAEAARLVVRNSGSYIPSDEVARVFDRFYRTDRSRSSSIGGAGLGLAIVKELVDLHRGRLTVESDQHLGTSFIVSLPAGASSSVDSPPREEINLRGKVQRFGSSQAIPQRENSGTAL